MHLYKKYLCFSETQDLWPFSRADSKSTLSLSKAEKKKSKENPGESLGSSAVSIQNQDKGKTETIVFHCELRFRWLTCTAAATEICTSLLRLLQLLTGMDNVVDLTIIHMYCTFTDVLFFIRHCPFTLILFFTMFHTETTWINIPQAIFNQF